MNHATEAAPYQEDFRADTASVLRGEARVSMDETEQQRLIEQAQSGKTEQERVAAIVRLTDYFANDLLNSTLYANSSVRDEIQRQINSEQPVVFDRGGAPFSDDERVSGQPIAQVTVASTTGSPMVVSIAYAQQSRLRDGVTPAGFSDQDTRFRNSLVLEYDKDGDGKPEGTLILEREVDIPPGIQNKSSSKTTITLEGQQGKKTGLYLDAQRSFYAIDIPFADQSTQEGSLVSQGGSVSEAAELRRVRQVVREVTAHVQTGQVVAA